MDLVGLINNFATGTYTVTRRARAAPVRGREQQAPATTLTVTASVQPLSGKDLRKLPEGRRANQMRVMYTTTELYVGDQGGGFEADQVTVDGEQWQVEHVETWHGSDGNTAYRCHIMNRG